jgi:hypothetical protein
VAGNDQEMTFMKTGNATYFAVSLAFVRPLMSAPPCRAQGRLGVFRHVPHPALPAPQIAGYTESSRVYHGDEPSVGPYTTIDVPFAGSVGTQALGINNAGEMVGYWGSSTGGGAGSHTSIDFPGAGATEGEGINDAGDVVGSYCVGNPCATYVEKDFLLRKGAFSTFNVPGPVRHCPWTLATKAPSLAITSTVPATAMGSSPHPSKRLRNEMRTL